LPRCARVATGTDRLPRREVASPDRGATRQQAEDDPGQMGRQVPSTAGEPRVAAGRCGAGVAWRGNDTKSIHGGPSGGAPPASRGRRLRLYWPPLTS
jgi:hypothetical protein